MSGDELPTADDNGGEDRRRPIFIVLVDAFVQLATMLVLLALGGYVLIFLILTPSFGFKAAAALTYLIGFVITLLIMVRRGWPAIFAAVAMVGVFAVIVAAGAKLDPVLLGP